MGKSAEADALGDRVKVMEREAEAEPVGRGGPFAIRLDGHAFSKWTRGFAKPLDARLVAVMAGTAEDLLREFPDASAAFTESDEITLVFRAPPTDHHAVPYNGRVQKLCSLTAGFASARFNARAAAAAAASAFGDGEEELAERCRAGRAYFDSRVIRCRGERDAADAVWWRFRHDTFRNGVNGLAQSVFGGKRLHGVPLGKVIEMLRERGVTLDEQPPELLYGTFAKRERYTRAGVDPRTGEEREAERTRVRSFVFPQFGDLTEDERTRFLLARVWPEQL